MTPRTQRRLRGIVWRRSDFRETSRLITFITAEHGKLTTLGKGAHRPGSQCLGRIDFLNVVDLKLSRGTLPILHRVHLVHEHRRLRDPQRYIAANYLSELFDVVILFGRGDPGLFELLAGALLLLERCAISALPNVLAGVELKFLLELGLLPPLLQCHRCGDGPPLFPGHHHPVLCCRKHAPPGGRPVPHAALRWLEELRDGPSRTWAGHGPIPAAARTLLGRFLTAALERHPQHRRKAFQGVST